MMQAAAKATSGAMESLVNTAGTPEDIVSPMEALTQALDQGVTLADLSKLTQEAMKAMLRAQ
jgi:hypothetical protein